MGGASEKALHERNIADGAGRDSLLPQDGEDGLGQGAQHLEAAFVVHAGILEAGGVEGAVGLKVLALEVDGRDLIAVPAADLVPDAALGVHRGVLGADVVRQIADDPQVGAGDGVQHHLDGLGGVHGMVIDALHREEHALLFADGDDLAEAAKQGLLRLFAAHGGLLCHVGGLAAHAACPQCLAYSQLALEIGYIAKSALIIYGQLDIGAQHGDLNMMKGALEECERISTVSPTYAKEILDPYFGHGLDEILRQKEWKLCGILNGIDTVGYNPSRDHALAANFSARKPEGKALCKAALQQQMHLPEEPDTPILAMVSRLVSHKGFDLVEYAMENMLRMGMQVVILGNGEYRYEEFFREMQRRHPQQVAFTCGFMPILSRQIYAGADFFLMPSQSEPCGLAQMIALRYGTIPIVRSTGGLADSIIDWDTPGGGCGFTFQSYNADDMLGAVRRAMGLYHSEYRAEMLPRALKCDFSWRRSAKQYMAMYLGI